MRSIEVLFSLVLLMTGISSVLRADPPCGSINQYWCEDEPDCTERIVWAGTCANSSRTWQCVWNCGGIDYPGTPQSCCCGCALCDCMLAGTQIGLADGGTKSVEDIKVGDRVLSWDEVTSSLTSGVVTDVYLPFISPSDGLVVHNKENCENYLQYCENCPPPR